MVNRKFKGVFLTFLGCFFRVWVTNRKQNRGRKQGGMRGRRGLCEPIFNDSGGSFGSFAGQTEGKKTVHKGINRKPSRLYASDFSLRNGRICWYCVRIAANRAKLSSVCKDFIGFFGGLCSSSPLLLLFPWWKKRRQKKIKVPRAPPILPWYEYAYRGRKSFALTEALQSKQKWKYPDATLQATSG